MATLYFTQGLAKSITLLECALILANVVLHPVAFDLTNDQLKLIGNFLFSLIIIEVVGVHKQIPSSLRLWVWGGSVRWLRILKLHWAAGLFLQSRIFLFQFLFHLIYNHFLWFVSFIFSNNMEIEHLISSFMHTYHNTNILFICLKIIY